MQYARIAVLLAVLVYARYRYNVNQSVATRLRQQRTPPLSHYDYIVVGGGSAGAVVASRLSEGAPAPHTVLLLEAGADDLDPEAVPGEQRVPMKFISLQKTPLDWAYQTEPQDNACLAMNNRVSNWPRGKMLGGSSSINAMQYVRGHPADFNSWAAALGGDGHHWSYTNLLPYFIKSEDASALEGVDRDYHGYGGPQTIETPHKLGYGNVFLNALQELGHTVGLDYNGRNPIGFGPSYLYTRGGQRDTSATAFLPAHVRRERSRHLHVLTGAHVVKVIFNASRHAVGVEYITNNVKRSVYTNREVILSAGAIGSPHILLLSGVGPTEHLNRFGIPVVSDLPGVGHNLQDHVYVDAPYFWTPEQYVLTPEKLTSTYQHISYTLFNSGVLSSCFGLELQGVTRSRLQDDHIPYPDIQYHVLPAGLGILGTEGLQRFSNVRTKEAEQFFGEDMSTSQAYFLTTLLHPRSRGHVSLRSADPYDHPVIQPNYLQHQCDVDTLVEGVRLMLKLNDTSTFRALNIHLMQKSPGGCAGASAPTWGSTAFWECYVRQHTFTVWHPVGTCKMGADTDPTAVLDHRLRVRGVTGLRVVDASVMPHLTSGNTNAPTVMIGEKGADMIRHDAMAERDGER